jgi:hypothetical protein
MRKRFIHLGILMSAVAAVSLASGVAFAQSSGSGAARFSGIATGPGTISRTITDTQPNAPGVGYGVVRVTGGTISVPVTNGQTAATIGQNFRTAASSVLGAGYSGVTTAPGSIPDPARIKIVRQTGTYAVSADGNTAPGITFTSVDPFTVQDAPALSPVGLGFLVGALPALAFWRRRRKTG